MRKLFFLPLIFVWLAQQSAAQCSTGQSQIRVVLKTDQYPQETHWKILDASNNTVLQSPANLLPGTVYSDSICVASSSCHHFQITDQAGDGICCAYGNGHFEVYYDNLLVKKDSSFGSQSSAWMGCAAGQNCNTALPAILGFQTASGPGTWYSFTPATTGSYTITTCGQNNTCNTKLWVYDYCSNLQYNETNAATIYYADDNCGFDAVINAYFMAGETYYIRVGDQNNSCTNTPINWEMNFNNSIVGCLDTSACNFNPFATINDPSSCLYYPNGNCPTGADLIVDSSRLSVTIQMDSLQSTNLCTVREGCMNGYGMRELVRFDTKIANVGATDFYAGPPPNNPNAYNPIFEWDQCHNHWHFEDYAEYLLADSNNNFIPIGYKNGFCVMDLSCTTGSAKFGCNNMGITAGCSDIYSSGLDCQWIDITDVADGKYKLIVRVNWVPRPDFYGRFESSYTNNWARACIQLHHDAQGKRQVTVLPNCTPYIDCNGVENGLAVKDCDGNCNGTRLTGDLNADNFRNAADITGYLTGAINHSLAATTCHDLNDDGKINVIDAALLFDCAKHGPGAIPAGHSHEPCRFPDRVTNPNQHANFSIGNIDYPAQTMDIFINNPDAKVLGYQLRLKGLTLGIVQNTIAAFSPDVQFTPAGEIIVLTNNEIPIPKNTVSTIALRVQWTSIDSNKVCLDSVVAVVNDAYEEISSMPIDSICLAAMVTPNGVATIARGRAHSLYPNPFTHSTTLYIDNPGAAPYHVYLYDVYGRKLRSYRQKTASLLIEKGDLPAGIYFLQAQGTDWEFKEKIVVR